MMSGAFKTGCLLVLMAVHPAFMAREAAAAAANFRPVISRIADQRVTASGTIPALSFTVDDNESAAAGLTLSAESSNATLLPVNRIGFGGSGASRTVTVSPVSATTGMSTVTVTVSDGEKTAASSFTVTVASNVLGNSTPVIQGVRSTILPSGVAYSNPLVVMDGESGESSLVLGKASSNETLLPPSRIVFGGQNYGRNVTVTPATGQTGRAVITLSVSDGTNTTSTSFVLDVVSSNTAPTLTAPGNQIIALGAAAPVAAFTVGDGTTPADQLRATATSSNTALLPNAGIALGGSGASRTVTLSPTAGNTGAATVRLCLSDGELKTEKDFLLVVHNPASPAEQFQRPRGVFILDSSGGASYRTTFGKDIELRDSNHRNLPFIDGFTLRVKWPDIESSTTPGVYDFHIIQNALNKLPAGQKLSILFSGGSTPTYIANRSGVVTWIDEDGIKTPVPWDPYLRERRLALLQALAAANFDSVPLAQHPDVVILNPFLPGGHTGLRDPNGTSFRQLPGYTRAKLLGAAQDELRMLTSLFPQKFIQIGFWKFTDNENAAYGGVEAWEYVRRQLLAEFDGVARPRIGFFMENLAARRTGPAVDPYTATPATSFATPMFLSQNEAWNGFQMLGCWVRPFNDPHVTNTLNGMPADAIEHAFNVYRAEYAEVYVPDIDSQPLQAGLKMWHDFFKTAATTVVEESRVGETRWERFE